MVRKYNFTILRIALCLFIILSVSHISLAQNGKIVWDRIDSPSLEGNLLGDSARRSFAVYLPHDYETSDKSYPSFYMLHGYGGNAGGSVDSIRSSMDNMIKSGRIVEMIAVFVDGNNKYSGSFYHSSVAIGDYEGYITRDIIEYVDSKYRTIPHRRCRGITGHSMGGHGSMYLAIKYPDVFSVVVSQGGFYENNGEWMRNLVRGTAAVEPEDWGDMNSLFWMTTAAYGYLAGTSPDPDNPPFFVARPYEKINGKIQEVPEIMDKWLNTGIVDGELDRYLQKPYQLEAIKIIHGRSDSIVSVKEAQTLDQVMTERGIEHIYEEHTGGHEFYADKSIQFLSDNLLFEMPEELVITSIDRKNKLASTWAEVK
ncbi:hypothetical protein GF312_04155 [Candidatus Poribacteria bacterium]|nr:hypothetical protein [Candidatus Poribacteria bacterium]